MALVSEFVAEYEADCDRIDGGGQSRGKSERSKAPQDDEGGRGLQRVWVDLSDAERQDRYDFWCGSSLASPNVSKEDSSGAAALAQQQRSMRAMDTALHRDGKARRERGAKYRRT